MNDSNPENHRKNNNIEKRPFSMAGETSIDQLNASVLDSSLYQVALPNPDEEIDYNHAKKGIARDSASPNNEEHKVENGDLTSSLQAGQNQRIDPQTSKKYARTYKNNKRYKLYWKIFTVLSSLAISGYLMVEAYALNCVIQEKSPASRSNSTVQYLMIGFLRMENLLYVNLYMNFIVYILGLIIILYSVIILLIERDQPWKWLKGRHKKVARWGYLLFVILYSIGGLVQTIFVLSHLKDPTIQSGGSYYAYMILRGVVFYLNMACFRKIEKFKMVQTEVFKDLIEKKKIKLDQEKKNLDVNWQQLYEVEDETDHQEQPPNHDESGIQAPDLSVVMDDPALSDQKIDIPGKHQEPNASQSEKAGNG